jgi:hypothetical protein
MVFGFWPHTECVVKNKFDSLHEISVHTLVRDASTKGRILKEPRRSRDPPSKGRVVQETPRSSDAPSKGRVVQGTGRPKDGSSKGRVVQMTGRPRDGSSKGRLVQLTNLHQIDAFSKGRLFIRGRNNIASFSEFLRCAWNRAKAVPATVIQAAHWSFRFVHHLL